MFFSHCTNCSDKRQSKENKYWGDVDFKLFDTATEHTCTCAFNVEWVSIYKRWRASRATSATCSIEKDAGAATAGKREEKILPWCRNDGILF